MEEACWDDEDVAVADCSNLFTVFGDFSHLKDWGGAYCAAGPIRNSGLKLAKQHSLLDLCERKVRMDHWTLCKRLCFSGFSKPPFRDEFENANPSSRAVAGCCVDGSEMRSCCRFGCLSKNGKLFDTFCQAV